MSFAMWLPSVRHSIETPWRCQPLLHRFQFVIKAPSLGSFTPAGLSPVSLEWICVVDEIFCVRMPFHPAIIMQPTHHLPRMSYHRWQLPSAEHNRLPLTGDGIARASPWLSAVCEREAIPFYKNVHRCCVSVFFALAVWNAIGRFIGGGCVCVFFFSLSLLLNPPYNGKIFRSLKALRRLS